MENAPNKQKQNNEKIKHKQDEHTQTTNNKK